jgi:hypothetical protein
LPPSEYETDIVPKPATERASLIYDPFSRFLDIQAAGHVTEVANQTVGAQQLFAVLSRLGNAIRVEQQRVADTQLHIKLDVSDRFNGAYGRTVGL